MSGETDLTALLATLSVETDEVIYVFATTSQVPDGINPIMQFQERQGITLILPLEEAKHHELDYEFASRKITLAVHSSLEAVGFMARIASVLAGEGISVNPVAGFYHDHLFVPADKCDAALHCLKQLQQTTSKK